MNKPTRQQTIIIGIIITLITLIAIYYIGRRQGKKAAATGNTGILPNKTDWGATLTEAESQAIINHATALHRDMKGINILPRDMTIYTAYLAATDRIFLGTANYFYQNYGRGQNLAQWIAAEHFDWTNLGAQTIADQILTRLSTFGINK